MYVKRTERKDKFPIIIFRASIEELDRAIADLEKRGFTLLCRGVESGYVACYSSVNNKKHAKHEFRGTEEYTKAWAKLEKVNKKEG